MTDLFSRIARKQPGPLRQHPRDTEPRLFLALANRHIGFDTELADRGADSCIVGSLTQEHLMKPVLDISNQSRR